MAQSKDWDVVVVGSCNTDYLIRGGKLPGPGETSQGDTFYEGPGGKGANQAVAAAHLGARVALVTRIGSDPRGDDLAKRLAAEGVDTRHLVRDSTTHTGVALIMVDRRGQKQIQISPGANGRFSEADVLAATPSLQAAKVVLAQLEVPVDAVTLAFRQGREAGARIVLDPAPAVPLPDELLRLVDVIRPNATEAEVLTGISVKDRATALEAANQLLQRGVGAVVVQAGDEGDLLVWPEGRHWLPRLPVESVDATGAGDAFAAAFAVLLAEGWSLVEAANFANAAAALATTKVGAQEGLPRREDVQALLSGRTTKP